MLKKKKGKKCCWPGGNKLVRRDNGGKGYGTHDPSTHDFECSS